MDLKDDDSRLANHFGGRQYKGWKCVREKLKELAERIQENTSRFCDRSQGGIWRGRERQSGYNRGETSKAW